MFSRRLPTDLGPNTLARARARVGPVPFDLTASNPTLCGFPYSESVLLPLSRPEGLVYRPEPLGLAEARQAVADELPRHGRTVDPDRVVLTASTSEAYALLFKLLCDPGDAVLMPSPSYPLLEHLAALEGVRVVAYRLDPQGDWQPDLGTESGDGARALIVVHPNNPTGSLVGPRSAAEATALCRRAGMALIADEVFLDYPLDAGASPRSFAGTDDVLTFTLGGLSKYLGLPQLKLSWTIVDGPAGLVREALERLAFLADNYLSVATPVQAALGELFAAGAPLRSAIRERCLANLAVLREAVPRVSGVELVPPGGGWSAVLRYPHVVDEESLTVELLEKDGVAVHPGYLFDFADSGYLALSLLPEPPVFEEGVRRLLARVAAAL